MKKFAVILLALTLVATLSVASFAATASAPGNESQNLAVGYTELTAAGTVYSVDIAWDSDLSFEYTAGQQGAWNPDSHAYGDTVGAGWTDATATVTVTNHSNAAIKANVTVEDKVSDDGVTFKVDKQGDQTIVSAVDKALDAAELTCRFTVTAEGAASKSSTAAATATVTIKAA